MYTQADIAAEQILQVLDDKQQGNTLLIILKRTKWAKRKHLSLCQEYILATGLFLNHLSSYTDAHVSLSLNDWIFHVAVMLRSSFKLKWWLKSRAVYPL